MGPIADLLTEVSLTMLVRHQGLAVHDFEVRVRKLEEAYFAGDATWRNLIDGIEGAIRRMANDSWTAED